MKSKGFTLIELLIAMGLSALFLPALVFVFSFSLGAASQGESYTQAYALAQENMEAIYHLRKNWDWDATPIDSDDSMFYQPYKVSDDWFLGTITNTPLKKDDGYLVTVQIDKVERVDSNGDGILDDIVETGGAEDKTTRKIIVTVTWKEKGVDTSIDLVSYVTKH